MPRSTTVRKRTNGSRYSRQQLPTNITPAFASWVRNVIVPALVKAYMRQASLKKGADRA